MCALQERGDYRCAAAAQMRTGQLSDRAFRQPTVSRRIEWCDAGREPVLRGDLWLREALLQQIA